MIDAVGDPAELLGLHGNVRRAVTAESLCLCSPYKPSAGFSVANAMGRNKIIYALSQMTVVVACEEGKGGTWGGATEALKQGLAPVWAWTGPGATAGTPALVALGARPLEDVEQLQLTVDHAPRPDPASQLALEP